MWREINTYYSQYNPMAYWQEPSLWYQLPRKATSWLLSGQYSVHIPCLQWGYRYHVWCGPGHSKKPGVEQAHGNHQHWHQTWYTCMQQHVQLVTIGVDQILVYQTQNMNSSPPGAAHIYGSALGSDNDLLPGRRQAIIWTNAYTLSIRSQGTYFNEILFEIQIFSFKKMHLSMSSVKWRPFCPRGVELR